MNEKITVLFGVLPVFPLPPAGASKKVVVGEHGREVELEIPSQDELAKIHPLLRTQPSFTLHRFGVGPDFIKWKESVFPRDNTETERTDKQGSNRRSSKKVGEIVVTLIESQRSTPPLFGVGLIDKIPDNVLEEVAAEQAKAAGDAPQSSKFERFDQPRCPSRGAWRA